MHSRTARSAIAVATLLVVVVVTPLVVGSALMRPARASVGAPPPELGAEAVSIRSASGAMLQGWFAQGRPGAGAVLLLHGVRSDRRSMAARAVLLHRAGYAVLLIDFQAHGESTGDHITFGARESLDARSALAYLRTRAPRERVGAIGASLGGAAIVLAEPPLALDAVVLEAVYPTIEQATTHRLEVHLGVIGPPLAPLVTRLLVWQLRPRLNVPAEALRPIDHIGAVSAPLLVIAGGADRATPLEESRALYARAAGHKELWVVPGAGHIDLYDFARVEYERRVLEFFGRYLPR